MIELQGREELERKLRPETIKQPLSEGIKKITAWLMRTVFQSTPVDKSRLRPSITQQITETEGRVGTNVEYAPFVEYGHSQQVGRYVHAIGKRLTSPWVPPSRVLPGTSMRVRDKGAFTYTLEQAYQKMDGWLHDLGVKIEKRFG